MVDPLLGKIADDQKGDRTSAKKGQDTNGFARRRRGTSGKEKNARNFFVSRALVATAAAAWPFFSCIHDASQIHGGYVFR